ncbi:MAG: tetratricopeptide repeat protein [Candidatus Gastranaerophilales bacterium]|nr:tetratricopeptide repeat protein [Candidatus Gastranaerophilales bacterium]
MKKLVSIIFIFLIVVICASDSAFAARKSSKGGLSPEELTKVTTDIEVLTKKVYSSSLFSPEDNQNLIDIKLKLDTAILSGASPEFAPLYYKAGNLYKDREFTDEAIECYQTVLENYADTPFSAKASKELGKMGIVIKSEEETEE